MEGWLRLFSPSKWIFISALSSVRLGDLQDLQMVEISIVLPYSFERDEFRITLTMGEPKVTELANL